MINVVELLKHYKDITSFEVRTIKKQSHELYFVHKSLETIRNVEKTDCSVTIYNLHDNSLGSSKFTVFSGDDIDTVKEKVELALITSKKINNKPFELPKKEIMDSTIESNMEKYTLKEIGEKISEACFKADAYEGGSINALEIFVNKFNEEILNSNGLDKKVTYYQALVEAIPTWTSEGESVEIYEQFTINSLDLEKITSELDSKMKEVEYRFIASKPEEKLNMKVALRPKEIYTLLSSLVSQVNVSTIFNHGNVFNVGDSLQSESNIDLLNVELKGNIKGCAYSKLFDNNGVSLVDTVVIKDGKYVSSFGNNRFSQYLNVLPTGALELLTVETGTLDKEQLNEPYLELVSLSGLQLEIYSDYIGGEIRLGYIHEGKKITPVTGISFSGKLSEVLNTIKLSKTITQTSDYLGPDLMLIDKVDIL